MMSSMRRAKLTQKRDVILETPRTDAPEGGGDGSRPEKTAIESQMLPGLGYGFSRLSDLIRSHLSTIFKRVTPSH